MLGKNLVFLFAALVMASRSVLKAIACDRSTFVSTSGSRFQLHERSIYFNGFNAYWLMYMGSDLSTRNKVSDTFEQASKYEMNVARTWAFSDGGYNSLQTSPGSYNENMFKGLDYVVSEAKRHEIYLILSLVNNWDDYGGKKQYVQWARDQGQQLNNDDDFYSNSMVKGFYKNHVKTVLTRVNSITGIVYKDDPTILAWELMNEPRCQSDLSGKPLQDWVAEMAAYVKSIDESHLVEIGLEGFYGKSMPERIQQNPNGWEFGTDFLSNNRVPEIDFATIHFYPEQWLPNSDEETQDEFVGKWIQSHVDDSKSILVKPLLVTEFGKSSKSPGYNVGVRDKYFERVYKQVFNDTGSCGGALFWQVMAPGMESWSDGYDVVLEQSPSTAAVVYQQSRRMSALNNMSINMN